LNGKRKIVREPKDSAQGGFYSPRLALYLYLALPLLQILPRRIDQLTMPFAARSARR
jgi:hypothetical protein